MFGYCIPEGSSYEVDTEARSRLLKQLDKVITDAIPVVVARDPKSILKGQEPKDSSQRCIRVTYAFDEARDATYD